MSVTNIQTDSVNDKNSRLLAGAESIIKLVRHCNMSVDITRVQSVTTKTLNRIKTLTQSVDFMKVKVQSVTCHMGSHSVATRHK